MSVRVHMTGLGYEYVRCRAAGDDSTIYIHQLTIIADGADPNRVFSDTVDVHHLNHIPFDNRPSNLELEESREHRVAHLEGREPENVTISEESETAPTDVKPANSEVSA